MKQLGPKPRARGRRLAALAAALSARPAVVRYGLAAAAYALLLLSTVLVRQLTGYRVDPTALVIILLIASSWYLGRGPGLLVAGLFEATLVYFSPRPLTSVLITFNRLILFTSVVLFASSRRRAEREREQLLARERAARAEAEEASRLKDEFLATVSHELRTPLTSILGWASMITGGEVKGETARHALEVIERNARAQAGIVDDILDVSRVITGKFHIETRPVDLGAVVRAVVRALQPAAEAKRIELSVETGGSEALAVTGDPDRLQQVVWNLLSNAIKFTPEGGRVEVSLGRSGSHAELGIADTGIGISEDFLPHVFERFRQADSSATRRHGGLGLGLAIVRHLVELHGGAVTAESAGEGRGTTFTVRLPAPHSTALPAAGEAAEAVAAKELQGAAAHTAVLTGLRVLVVDDEPDTLEVICSALNSRGAVVRQASSSGEALATLAGWTPDVLISDLAMPGEDGFALINRVRAMGPGRGGDVPAAALTAYVREEDRRRAIAAGFQTHIVKPVDPAALAGAVAELAKRR
jgi:signal transduction histidine kinase/ActR/RegA family two-component response regulator